MAAQHWDGLGCAYKKNLQLNRNEARRVCVLQFAGPSLWKHGLHPCFTNNNITIKKYGNIWKLPLTLRDFGTLVTPDNYLVLFIPGDPDQGTQDMTIYGRDIM